jgi:hypothetical protein
MTTHDADPGGPSGLTDSIPGPPQAAQPELDACGLPAQNRGPTGRTGRHAVDPAGASHTFDFRRRRHLLWGIVTLAVAAFFLTGAIAAQSSSGTPDAEIVEIWYIALGLPLVWLGIRQLRAGVRISGGKLIIRRGFRTRTVNVSEIRAATLRYRGNQESPRRVPRVELVNGKSIWINNLDCGRADRPPDPRRAARFNEFRALLGVADGDGMTIADTHAGGPSSLKDSRHGELPQSGEPELDAHGVPVQDRPANGRISLGVTACLIATVVSIALPIVALKYHSVHSVPRWLALLAVGAGFLASGLAATILGRAEKKKQQLGVARRSIFVAGGIVGLLALTIMLTVLGAPPD